MNQDYQDSKYQELINDAKIAREKGDLSKAIELYEEAFQTEVVIEDLIDLGIVYLNSDIPLKAMAVFKTVIENFPNIAYGYYGLGLSLEALGKVSDSIDNYEKAIRCEENFSDAYFSIALIYDDAHEDEKACKYYTNCLIYEPNHFWANLNLGSLYERRNYLELALEHTKIAYRINNNEKMVAYNLGVIYGKLKKYEEAKKYYLEETLKTDGFISAYLNLGLIYKDIDKNYKKAKMVYLEGIQKDKDNASLWYNLACIYAKELDYENTYSCLLYSIIRDRNNLVYLETDEELNEFKKTSQYQKLNNQFVIVKK